MHSYIRNYYAHNTRFSKPKTKLKLNLKLFILLYFLKESITFYLLISKNDLRINFIYNIRFSFNI